MDAPHPVGEGRQNAVTYRSKGHQMAGNPFAEQERVAAARLYPYIFSRAFRHLTLLRKEMTAAASATFPNRKDLVLIDFGCGSAPYRPLLEQYTANYLRADFPNNAFADVHISPDGTVPLPDSYADVVLSTQVLEHVDCPQRYLQECRRLLKPSGLLVLSAPGYWVYHPYPQDYWRWTGSGLKKLVKESGFELIRFKGLMGTGPSAIQLLQDSLWPKCPRLLRRMLTLVCQCAIMALEKLLSQKESADDACVYVLVARKT